MKRTGTIQSWTDATGKKRWRARIRLGDGSRPWLPVPDGFSEARAREFAASMQEQEDAKGGILAARRAVAVAIAKPNAPGSAEETVVEWFGRYYAWREQRGRGAESIGDSRGRFKKWISPQIGGVAMRAVTRDMLEGVVGALDDAVDEETIAPKTALNIWGEVTAGFGVATSCKDRTLRVLEKDPSERVEGPDAGEQKSKPFLRPAEIDRLLSCVAVPIERRHVYALVPPGGSLARFFCPS